MPQSDFLIGLEAGSNFAGGIINDRMARAEMELKRKQLENEQLYKQNVLEQNKAGMDLDKARLEEQSRHHQKLEEWNAFQMEGMKLDRDQKLLLEKQRIDGRSKVAQFQRDLDAAITSDPSGSDFGRKWVDLRSKNADLFVHPSKEVVDAVNGIEMRANDFLKQSDNSRLGKELVALVDAGLLKQEDRANPEAVMAARTLRDTSMMRSEAASAGLSPMEIDSIVPKTPRIAPSGGWSPEEIALTKSRIERTVAGKSNMAKPSNAKVTLDIPEVDPATGQPMKDISGANIKAGKMEFNLSDVYRDPSLKALAERSGLKLGSKRLRVISPEHGEGFMTEEAYKENILRGHKLDIIGAE